jgi:archaeal flagellin N-terminal-like domain
MKENAVSEVIGVVLLLALVVIGVSLVGVIIFFQPVTGEDTAGKSHSSKYL